MSLTDIALNLTSRNISKALSDAHNCFCVMAISFTGRSIPTSLSNISFIMPIHMKKTTSLRVSLTINDPNNGRRPLERRLRTILDRIMRPQVRCHEARKVRKDLETLLAELENLLRCDPLAIICQSPGWTQLTSPELTFNAPLLARYWTPPLIL